MVRNKIATKNIEVTKTLLACRIRQHTNFLGVINRATIRMGLKNNALAEQGSIHGSGAFRSTCLSSGSMDNRSSDHVKHRKMY